MFNSSILFTLLIFWVLYKERPSFKDAVGMGIMLTGVVIMSVAKPPTKETALVQYGSAGYALEKEDNDPT